MTNKLINGGLRAAIVAAIIASGLSVASAQTVTASGTAPVIYDQSGGVINEYNSSTGALNPGWYYNSSGQPVYYYSNGTYYNETTGTYGGTDYYLNGTGSNGIAPAYTGTTVTTPVYTTTSTGNSSGNMIILYNQPGGTPVNTVSGTTLPAGNYYTSSGQQVYYYGNGTYYNPSTGTYGGSVDDPTGLAGTYYYNSAVTPATTGSYVTPGVPDTGMGGEAPITLLTLLASGLILVGGATYLTRQAYQR